MIGGAFLARLISGDEAGVDSVIVGGIVALAVLIGTSVYVVIQDHASWSPITYATGASTIIAAIAGGKGARDRLSGINRGSPDVAPPDPAAPGS